MSSISPGNRELNPSPDHAVVLSLTGELDSSGAAQLSPHFPDVRNRLLRFAVSKRIAVIPGAHSPPTDQERHA